MLPDSGLGALRAEAVPRIRAIAPHSVGSVREMTVSGARDAVGFTVKLCLLGYLAVLLVLVCRSSLLLGLALVACIGALVTVRSVTRAERRARRQVEVERVVRPEWARWREDVEACTRWAPADRPLVEEVVASTVAVWRRHALSTSTGRPGARREDHPRGLRARGTASTSDRVVLLAGGLRRAAGDAAG